MVFILWGSMAFILFLLFDYYNMRNFTLQKNITRIAGLGVFIYSTVMSIVKSSILQFPVAVQLISTWLLIASLALLIYSLLLERPFKATYADDNYNNSLVNTGTYALCRHPGVLWLFFTMLFLFFMTGAVNIAAAGMVWTSINIIYVYIQEKLFLINMFSGYESYQKTTPMLIPSKDSLKKCIQSFYVKGGYSNEKLR
jgi:protein-S-isoprenylcysteine O-methyltransferase Ste14